MIGNTSGLLKHSVVVPENVFLKYVFQMGGGGLRGKKFMFSQEASNFSFFRRKKEKDRLTTMFNEPKSYDQRYYMTLRGR